MSTPDARAWPLELRVSRKARTLTIRFDDGRSFVLPAEYLRVMTPSAEDRGHGAGPGRTVAGKRNVGIRDVRPIGRYAARIDFDDGHDTGLYSWDELWRLGHDQARLWSEYERRLADEGLSRDV
jgi:DUF971 family protein